MRGARCLARWLLCLAEAAAPPAQPERRRELGAKVRSSFLASDRTYGAGRVWHDMLAVQGVSCGLHPNVSCGYRLSKPVRAGVDCRPIWGSGRSPLVAANVLNRSFEAPAPNRKWIADFTYVWTAEGWLMWLPSSVLAARCWLVDECRDDGATRDRRPGDGDLAAGKPDALLHHSDRGSQYTSEQFQKLMADHGVVCSMSRSGNVWDNAAMESFFSSLKTERTARKTYRTRDEAKADVFDYIECFDNPKRRHSTIGYLSPVEFEMQVGFVSRVSTKPGAGHNRQSVARSRIFAFQIKALAGAYDV